MDSPAAPSDHSDDSGPARDEASGEPEGAPGERKPETLAEWEALVERESGSETLAEHEALVETAPLEVEERPRPGVGWVSRAPVVEAATDHRPPSTALLVSVAFAVAAADIGTKEWAKWALAGPELRRVGKHITAIPNYVDFIFAQNPGGAWSFLRGMPDGLRRPFFLFVSAAAIVFIVTVYRRLDRRQWAMRWGLPLALGGAIGNLVDRVRYGWVVDFIDMYWKRGDDETHWPTFNVADIAIVIGVGLMALDLLSLRRSHDAPPGKAAAETA